MVAQEGNIPANRDAEGRNPRIGFLEVQPGLVDIKYHASRMFETEVRKEEAGD